MWLCRAAGGAAPSPGIRSSVRQRGAIGGSFGCGGLGPPRWRLRVAPSGRNVGRPGLPSSGIWRGSGQLHLTSFGRSSRCVHRHRSLALLPSVSFSGVSLAPGLLALSPRHLRSFLMRRCFPHSRLRRWLRLCSVWRQGSRLGLHCTRWTFSVGAMRICSYYWLGCLRCGRRRAIPGF